MDKVEATPARVARQLPWDDEARALLDRLVDAQPVLVRISAAKRLRDAAERRARETGAERVSGRVDSASDLAYRTFTNPVVKALAVGTGTRRAVQRLKGDKRRVS